MSLDAIYYLNIIVEFISIFVLAGLLYVYFKNYKEVKTGFTIGLLFFASVFMIKHLLHATSLFYTQFSSFDQGLYALIYAGLELLALSVLLKLVWE